MKLGEPVEFYSLCRLKFYGTWSVDRSVGTPLRTYEALARIQVPAEWSMNTMNLYVRARGLRPVSMK